MPDRNFIIERDDGSRWLIFNIHRTSDGYALGTGQLIDEDDKPIFDSYGFHVIHSFFLGKVSVS